MHSTIRSCRPSAQVWDQNRCTAAGAQLEALAPLHVCLYDRLTCHLSDATCHPGSRFAVSHSLCPGITSQVSMIREPF